MPWIYKLELTEYREADVVQDDWTATVPGDNPVNNANGGVQVLGSSAAIVSDRKNPEYGDMENLDYVRTITEDREIPSDKVYHFAGDQALDPTPEDPL